LNNIEGSFGCWDKKTHVGLSPKGVFYAEPTTHVPAQENESHGDKITGCHLGNTGIQIPGDKKYTE
jgi:hypothetical protein